MKLEGFKENTKKKIIVISFTVLCLLLIAGVYLYTSYAFYEETKNFNVINGTVEDPGDLYFAYYVDGKISRTMPSKNIGYTLDTTKSSCDNGVTVDWDYSKWKANIYYENYSATDKTRTKCTLFFNKTAKTVKTALGNIEVNSYKPDLTKSACDTSNCESHEKGIFETTDADGTSYYYRGAVENNYLKFAGYFWRVVRINGNGSIRIIYDGTSAHSNGESSTDRQYGTSQFNTAYNNNMYLGYMYTSGDAHGTGTSSAIKTNVDKFYTAKLASYASKLDTNAGFCGDRSNLNLLSGVGTGTVTTYNKGYLRVEESAPTLTCENTNDYYTVSSASSGNKKLSYPIGLITADEVMLAGHAGGVFDGSYNHMKSNNGSYLVTGNAFWTMTPAGGYNPFGATGWRALVFGVYASGAIDDNNVYGTRGLRPVVNLKSGVTITGSGTKTNPYIVS